MKCPFCQKEAKIQKIDDNVGKINVAVCDQCANLFIIENDVARLMTSGELEQLKSSSTYTEVLLPLQEVIKERNILLKDPLFLTPDLLNRIVIGMAKGVLAHSNPVTHKLSTCLDCQLDFALSSSGPMMAMALKMIGVNNPANVISMFVILFKMGMEYQKHINEIKEKERMERN